MAIEIGQEVRLVAPTIQGQVTDINYDKSSKSLSMLVEYVDGEGESQSRWFAEAQLEVVA